MMAEPLEVTSPAEPTGEGPGIPRSSPGLVVLSSASPTSPVVSTPEGSPSCRAATMDQYLPWTGSSFEGESADRPLPPASLTPRPTGLSHHAGESDVAGGALGLARFVSRGPL